MAKLSAVEKELRAAAGGIKKTRGETADQFKEKLARTLSSLSDTDFAAAALSPEAAEWYNVTVRAIKTNHTAPGTAPLPDFPAEALSSASPGQSPSPAATSAAASAQPSQPPPPLASPIDMPPQPLTPAAPPPAATQPLPPAVVPPPSVQALPEPQAPLAAQPVASGGAAEVDQEEVPRHVAARRVVLSTLGGTGAQLEALQAAGLGLTVPMMKAIVYHTDQSAKVLHEAQNLGKVATA